MQCETCKCTPSDNNERYYSIRTSKSGIEFTEGMSDAIKCQECLESWIKENGTATIVSILRVHHPVSVGDV